MWFGTGKPHPLASKSTLEMTVTGVAAHNLSDTEVIGDYILYWVGAPMYSRYHEGTLCTIFLVAWKEGWVTEVRHTLYAIQNQKLILLSARFAPPAQACTARSSRSYQTRSSF